MTGGNLLFANVANGNTFTLAAGFLFASIYPESGATYTIQNSLPGAIENVSTVTSAAIDTTFTIPPPPSLLTGWNEHVITASGGSVLIIYATGQ